MHSNFVERSATLCGVLLFAGVMPAIAADWSPVAPGIDYREYVLDGPVRVYVARADRQTQTWTLDTMTSLGEVKGGRETVPDMVNRSNDSITFDGRRYDIRVAINGDYFDMKTGVANGGQFIWGWFAKRFVEYGGSGLIWTSDRRCFIGGNVRNSPKLQHAYFVDGSEMKIDTINGPRGHDGLALYTPQFAGDTGTSADGVELVISVNAPLGIPLTASGEKGRIVQVRRDSGATPLMFDTVVLSGSGFAAKELIRHAHEGDDIRIALGLQDFGNTDIGLPAGDWNSAWAGLGGTQCILVKGKVPRNWEAKAEKYAAEGKKHGSVIQDPRTAIAFNNQYIYFLVIDGRTQASRGMTFTEAGNFCRDELLATDATLQDGGGSSVLWVDRKIKNHPSGKPGQDEAGALRPVANGWFMAEVLEPRRSDRFHSGQKLKLPANAQVRVGPGTNYKAIATAPAGQEIEIQEHRLSGIGATQGYWWYCKTKDTAGWLHLQKMESVASRPNR